MAPVKRAMVDNQIAEELSPGPSAVVGASPGPIPMTRMPRALSTLTVPWTVAPPAGTTAPTIVLVAGSVVFATYPVRLSPGVSEE